MGKLPQPGQDGVVPPRIGVPDPEGLDQLDRLGERFGCHAVPDRLFGRPVVTMPGVGAAVEYRGQARLAPLELDPEQLRKYRVKAVTSRLRRRAGRGTGCSETPPRASLPIPRVPTRHRTEGPTVVRASKSGS